MIAIVALVALRIGIGWHFFKVGAEKMNDRSFSSAPFLRNAKGPLAGMYHGMLRDEDGLWRLNYDPQADEGNRINAGFTRNEWAAHKERVKAHYQFNDDQKKLADRVYSRYETQLNWFFSNNEEDINKYFKGLERRSRNAADPARSSVYSLRAQSDEIAADLRKDRAGWLAEIDRMWTDYDRELNDIAADEQKSSAGTLRLNPPGDRFFDVDLVDRVIPYFDLTIGVLLIVGLFTRPTSVVASLFLLSVILSQWPWSPGVMPVYPQMVEMLALLVLAAVGAGRFAGLDFFVRGFRFWCCPPKKQGTKNESTS